MKTKTKSGAVIGQGDGAVTFVIRVNGDALPDTYEVVSVTTCSEVNSVAGAKFTLLDGSVEKGTFDASSSFDFEMGNLVDITAGYNGENTRIFQGVITGQSISVAGGVSTLEVECRDRAIQMTIERKNRSFTEITDSTVVNNILDDYEIGAGMGITTTVYPELVQYFQTDWDFVLARAKANKMIVITEAGDLFAGLPHTTTPVLMLEYGTSISGFKLNLYSGFSEEMIYRGFAKVRGTVKFQGSALARPGVYITLAGLGSRFNGEHFVSGVSHTIENGYWQTEITVGLEPSRPVETPGAAAHGILPSARGLYSAVVKQISDDPKGHFRVLVEIPIDGPFSAGIWARLANFYATANAGSFFIPEVGDDVVVGFLNEDPRYPIVLGSLYSNPGKKPGADLVPTAENYFKAITSKKGGTLLFDDQSTAVSIRTPNRNMVFVNDGLKQVGLLDEHGNSIMMTKDGVVIRSRQNLVMQSLGKIVIDGKKGVAITSAEGDVTMAAININETAQVGYTAKGNSTAEVSASGQVTVKGGLVTIN